MEQCRGGNHAGKHVLDRFDLQTRIEIGERAVGKNAAEIKSNQRAAAAENKAHESADVMIFFDTGAIINPDQRKVLHVVKELEQGNRDETSINAVVAVTTGDDLGDQQS